MNTVIILFILIANIVAILLTYYSFSKDFEKSKKLFYTMISMGVIYIITLIVYLLSTIGIAKEVKGNWDGAKSAYEKIKKDYPSSNEGTQVEKYIARADAMMAK